jgi:hypothetical protein
LRFTADVMSIRSSLFVGGGSSACLACMHTCMVPSALKANPVVDGGSTCEHVRVDTHDASMQHPKSIRSEHITHNCRTVYMS